MSRREHLLPYQTRRALGVIGATVLVVALIPVVALPALKLWIAARRKVRARDPETATTFDIEWKQRAA
jgi:hypothetical protein